MANSTYSTQPDDGEKTRPSRKVIVSAAVLAVIMALGIVLSTMNLFTGDKTPTPTQAAPTPSPSTTPSAPDGQASVCGLTKVELTGTVATAPMATWTLVGTTAAPSIKDHGPGKTEPSGYRSCYSHTPTGALVAAANYVALGSYGAVRKEFYAKGTVPGPGRDILMKKIVSGAQDGGVRIQIAGFRLLRYSGSQADVDIAFRTSSGAIGGTVANLEWSGGDWKMRVADDGSEMSPIVQLPSMEGYIPWSGA